MMTRTQKDQVWDIIPSSFNIPVSNSNTIVNFLKDGISTDNDIQVLETFQSEPVRYPTIQIQYSKAETRVNFMNHQFGDEFDHTIFLASNTPSSWSAVLSTALIYEPTFTSLDNITQMSITARMPSTSTSYLQIDVFTEDVEGNFNLSSTKEIYYEKISYNTAGTVIKFPVNLNPKLRHKLRFRSEGDGSPTDLGIEIALDVGGNVVHEIYIPTYYEVFGSVEDLIISVRVVAIDKLTYQLPGIDEYIEAQDIVDTIVKNIELAFFQNYNYQVELSEIIKVMNEYDVTELVSRGDSERLAAKQVDFLVANENKLRSSFVTPIDADILIITDSSSNTL